MISRKGIGESSPCSAMKLQAWIEEENDSGQQAKLSVLPSL
jgi:hypothetical protein